MTDEMDFELAIGPGTLHFEDGSSLTLPRPKKGVYYAYFNVIAVDQWTGEESVEWMVDVLSHEFVHHLLKKMFGKALIGKCPDPVGDALDHIRDLRDYESTFINERGAGAAWYYLRPVAKFAAKVCALLSDKDKEGNGII